MLKSELHLKGVDDEKAMEAYCREFPDWAASAASDVPDYMLPGLARWVMWGIAPGSFMQAVLRNDLKEAAGRADAQNMRRLWHWARVMVNCVPAEAQGREDLLVAWQKRGGVLGRCKACGQPCHIPDDPGSTKVADGICIKCQTEGT